MTEGWTTFKYKDGTTERRFIPLGQKQRSRHCKSCAKIRKLGDTYYCDDNPNLYVDPDTEACENFVNRTWRNG
jgi:hypothetical protein